MQMGRSKPVLVFIGGGLNHLSGGVGTLMRYLIAEWEGDPAALPVRVVDTRGTGGVLAASGRFAAGVATLLGAGLTGRVACAHVHMTTRGSALRKSLLCLLARALGVPVILHLHGADFFDFHAGLPARAQRWLRTVIAGADGVVVIGAAWRARLVRELGVPERRVHVVLNGVPAAPRAVPAAALPPRLFRRRLGARNGVGALIEALAAPELHARSWTATIAGDGEAGPYRARIAELGLSHRVAMPGWQDAASTQALLATAAVLVLPSHHEVMPVAVLEAAARGIAIVTTPVGSVPEILQDGVSARLVPPGNVEALAHALGDLLDCPHTRARLGTAALCAFHERLDVATAAARIQALYRDAAAPRRQPAPALEAAA